MQMLIKDPLYGCLAVVVLAIVGGVLWFKADKPLFGLPLMGAAGYIAYQLFRAIGN
jgi:hypothetical protein